MANPAHAFALSGSNLISFHPASPTVANTIAITNLAAGETLVGIDFRPQNGMLYGLGVNAAANTATLYGISTRTGFAFVVGGVPGQIAFTTDGVTAVDLPDPATVGYSFDFNPVADRIRVTTDSGLNFRINPNSGLPIDGDAGTLGTNPDGAINTGSTSADGAAYTNNQPNSVVTTLYTLDSVTNSLFIQSPPNAGTQTLGQTVTLNGSPLDFSSATGFDIASGVNAAAPDTPVVSGSALALLTVGGTTALYSIDLTTAAATLVGNLLNGTTPATGLAVQSDLGGIPAVALSADGTSLLRFNTAAPGTTTAVSVTGVNVGEILVGIDFRPATGQLYGFGADASAETGTTYVIDPQTGVATALGAPLVFVDLPAGGYGFDFNPTVDRIRITTDSGLNFRINPNNGSLAGSDVAINGGATGVSAAAYTNNYGQSPLGPPPATLYTLDPASDTLFIQNPANAGTQISPHAVTLGGSPLDFSSANGFDIPASVRVATTGAAASGFGYAALTVAGVTGLYLIDLATGAAQNLGVIGTGAVALAGLALGDAPSAPIITSDGGGATAAVAVAENNTPATIVTATDGDFDALTFAIIGGADAARFQINASTGALTFIAAPDFETATDADHNNSYIVQVRASDGGFSDTQTLTVNVTDVNEVIQFTGSAGNDTFNAPGGSARIDAFGGVDTVNFAFRLVDATVTYSGDRVIIDTASSHTVLTGVERFAFTDGTVDNNDGNRLVDDLFYYAKYHDVWNAHADADTHYDASGRHEGRDPSAFFSTVLYQSANPDVAAAGVNPLSHFDATGWREGRIPSLTFDPAQYLTANPDVAAANVDPLLHFLTFGHQEGRQPFAPTELLANNGFDYVYYLAHNPDVKAAGVDPFGHFQTNGWHEGRNPNALFDVNGYLSNYGDVAAANINPLDHYNRFGWHEGRDPSVGFDTTSYLAAYPDVAAAGINPLTHFLAFGIHEGRSPFADGVWG